MLSVDGPAKITPGGPLYRDERAPKGKQAHYDGPLCAGGRVRGRDNKNVTLGARPGRGSYSVARHQFKGSLVA